MKTKYESTREKREEQNVAFKSLKMPEKGSHEIYFRSSKRPVIGETSTKIGWNINQLKTITKLFLRQTNDRL